MRVLFRWSCVVTMLALLASCAPGATVPASDPGPTPIPVDTLRLSREEFPRLNGSTSTAPLARAVCSVLLGESIEEVEDLVNFSKTTQSYRTLMFRTSELLIAAEPAESVVREKEEAGFEWEMAPIATDALVFLVNEANPVESLTVEQVQKIYTGEITNWSQVGGEDREIIPFQRNAEAGSQTLMKKLVMGDLELMEPPKEYTVASMEGLIEAVRSFDGSPGAIGYTVYYYANDMNMADGLKVVSIGGAAPEAESIRSGAYPFTNPYYAVIAADEPEESPARQVFDWLQGEIGQSLIQHEGYVSILDDPAPVDWNLGETEPLREVYTRLSDEPMEELVPSEDYGPLLTYIGGIISGSWSDYDKYGLVTRQGQIVLDPVCEGIWQLNYYDTESRNGPMLAMSRTLEIGESRDLRYALAALDGSWVTGFDYLSVQSVSEDRVWAVLEDGTGVMLDENARELWRLPLGEGDEPWTYTNNGSVLWRGGFGVFWSSRGEFFVDMEGNMISSEGKGWDSLQGFSEGLCVARLADGQDGDRWGYIDGKGKWVIPPIYGECWGFQNGKAMVKQDGEWLIIDKTGRVLLRTDRNIGAWTSPKGTWYLVYDWTQNEEGNFNCWVDSAYDGDLNRLNWEMEGETLEWGSGRFMYRRTDEGVELCNPYESYTFPVPNGLFQIGGGDDVMVFSQKKTDEDDSYLLSAWSLDGTEILPAMEADYISVLADSVTQKKYILASVGNRYKIYSMEGEFLVDTMGYPSITDGLVSCWTDLSYGYKDLKGDWVFRISLMKSMGD